MKRKLYILIACAIASTLVFTACSKDKTTEGEGEDGASTDITVDLGDPSLPPVDDTNKALYAGAQAIYEEISLGTLPTDQEQTFEKDDYTYYKVDDPRFTTYDEFNTYLAQYFTESFINGEILSDSNLLLTKDDNGDLYFLGMGRGTNIYYAGHTFEVDKEGEQEMTLRATAYYNNELDTDTAEPFFTAPENPDDYTVQTYAFTLLPVDGAWRFDNFHLFY